VSAKISDSGKLLHAFLTRTENEYFLRSQQHLHCVHEKSNPLDNVW